MKICPKVLSLVLGLCVLSACSGQKSAESAKIADTRPEVEVYVVPAGTAPGGGFSTPSSLAVEHEADLLAEEEGQLVEVLTDEGRRVKRGQVLARLDDSKLRKQFDQDRAEMQSAETQAHEAVVLRQAAEVELQRQGELRKEGLGSQRDFDRARFNLEAMRQEVEKAHFDLEKAKAKVAADELRLFRMELRAPFDGIVSRRYARVGHTLLRDEKVLRLTELRPLLVRFTAPEAVRRAAVTGAVVEVQLTDQPATVIRARVIRTGYVVDTASGAVECTARLLDPLPPNLVPGMAVRVEIPGAAPQAAAAGLWVPRAALRRGVDGTGEVFAVNLDRLQRRSVKLGRETTASVQVLGGISPGDKIVTQASGKLQDGMSVRVRP